MKKLILSYLIAVVSLFSSCGGDDGAGTKKNDQVTAKSSCLDFVINEKPLTLDPIKIKDVGSFHILSQIYEPLLKFSNKGLELEPLLVDSWSLSDDNLVYTFNLKKGVYFHANPLINEGKKKEFHASDVIYSFERIFSDSEMNYAYSLFKNTIKGAEQFKNTGGNISGIEALDDYTVTFTLTEPSSIFISLMATTSASIVTKKAIEKNITIGTGPFTYNKKNDTEFAITLLKNNNYHLSDKENKKLPYIDSIAFNYIGDGEDQLSLFKEGKLDVIVEIPPESVTEIVQAQISNFQNNPSKYILGSQTKLRTSFLNLNTSIIPFNNVKIRKAFSLALNKEKIVNNVLKGEAFGPGNNGIVSPAIKNYSYSSVNGHKFNNTEAQKLLAEAGYPQGEGFPQVKLSVRNGITSLRVALEIQKQLLANLNINIEISSLLQKEIMVLNDSSQTEMSLNTRLAEFPDPLSFLSIFYSANVPASNKVSAYPNESRYKNAKFDNLYEQATTTLDEKKRYELCLQADQIIAKDVPIIPLWYHEDYQLIQASVKNYKSNPLSLQHLTHVKIEALPLNKKEE